MGGRALQRGAPLPISRCPGGDRPVANQRPKHAYDARGPRAGRGICATAELPAGPTDPGQDRPRGAHRKRDAMTLTATETDSTRAARLSGAAGDSVTVAAWTLVSRVTGVVKIAAIGAVLGPTFFGNAYQFTNSVPNLIYYGFLAGSLFSSLLVPALVHHIDTGDRASSER